VLLFFSACQKKHTEVKISLNEKLNFNFFEYFKIFKNQFASIDGYIIQNDSLITYYDTLKYFYSLRDYQPLFIKSFDDNDKVFSLISILERAGEYGLNPEQYHFSDIINDFAGATDTVPNLSRYYLLAMTELLVSDAILKYSYHLRYGIVNPKTLFPDTYFRPIDDSSKGSLLESLTQENFIRYLNDIQPKSKRYKDLQTELEHFESYKDSDWQIIPSLNIKLEPGDKNSSMVPIIKRLITLGFLDTSTVRIKDFNVYDTLLVNSLKHFQRVNGLNDDGVIGKNTIEHLNTAPQEYINKIKLNLERFRWNNYTDTAQYVLVNIPDFRLFIYDKGNEIFTSKVCVGRKRPSSYEKQLERYKKTRHWEDKPEDWQTPITNGELSYLVLNPTWSVPESIIREEIFQKVSKDSNYLIDHNFKVYLDTSEVDPAKITLNDLSAKEIPYKIVQGPGAGNALGKIKFIFPNRFGIYLHDTPTRPPFKYSNRAVSHGCIRVENPMPLAEFLLKDHPKWNIDFLKIEIGQKVEDKLKIAEYKKIRNKLRKDAEDQKTTEVYLSRKVPVFIDYYTAWVDENGEINFRDDVYNLDKILMEYLTTHNLL